MKLAIIIIGFSSVVSTVLLFLIKMSLDYIIYYCILGDEE